jgi:hypothetical protein
MYEVERIPKNGIGPKEQGSYPFVRAGDAADVIRKALADKVVTMMPTHVQVVGQSDRPTSKGGTMTTVDLVVDWTITDGDSGESITLQTFGAGADTGDKYSGKAMTSAMKYAFLAGFLLSTGDDTENQDTSDRRSAAATVYSGNNPPPPMDRPGNVKVGSSPRPTTHEATADGGLVGIAQLGDAPADYQLREEPEGWALSFKLMDGRKGFRVVARDDLAQALAVVQSEVIGQRVICHGKMGTASFSKDGRTITYNVLDLERIEASEWTLPAPSDVDAELAALPMFAETVA